MLFAGLVVLILGGDYLVKGASRIALRLHMSPLVVGLTIVAFGTSAPELLISIRSALSGSPDIAMGNVIGSNICNLALVLGVTAMITNIKVTSNIVRIDWMVTMVASILLFILVQDYVITYVEGIVFVSLLIFYTVFIIRKSRKESFAERKIEDKVNNGAKEGSQKIYKDILYIFLGSVGLFFGADWFVTGAQELAGFLGISERVIGITVVALGTSLPELVTGIVASFKKQTDLALGNLLGSNIFNIFSILGITSILTDIRVSAQIVHVDMIWMLGITLLLLPFMISSRTIERYEGGLLLLVYAVYIYFLIS